MNFCLGERVRLHEPAAGSLQGAFWIHFSNLQSISVLPSYPTWFNQIKLIRIFKKETTPVYLWHCLEKGKSRSGTQFLLPPQLPFSWGWIRQGTDIMPMTPLELLWGSRAVSRLHSPFSQRSSVAVFQVLWVQWWRDDTVLALQRMKRYLIRTKCHGRSKQGDVVGSDEGGDCFSLGAGGNLDEVAAFLLRCPSWGHSRCKHRVISCVFKE